MDICRRGIFEPALGKPLRILVMDNWGRRQRDSHNLEGPACPSCHRRYRSVDWTEEKNWGCNLGLTCSSFSLESRRLVTSNGHGIALDFSDRPGDHFGTSSWNIDGRK